MAAHNLSRAMPLASQRTLSETTLGLTASFSNFESDRPKPHQDGNERRCGAAGPKAEKVCIKALLSVGAQRRWHLNGKAHLTDAEK
jgi:hypothetical protein